MIFFFFPFSFEIDALAFVDAFVVAFIVEVVFAVAEIVEVGEGDEGDKGNCDGDEDADT